MKAQVFKPQKLNTKWSYTDGKSAIFEAEYDTAFNFNRDNKLALVAKINAFNTEINPLTGEKEIAYDYFYINSKNQKLKILPNDFPDSLENLPHQQEFHLKYLEHNPFLYVLFQDKVYLFSSEGKQLTPGFDNIIYQEKSNGFILENSIEKGGKLFLMKGFYIPFTKSIIPCKYKNIQYNARDSIYYCCSAVFDNSKNDDIYSINGKLIAYHSDHIEFSSKSCIITRLYEPKVHFYIEDKRLNKHYELDGDELIPLQNNNCLIISKSNYSLINLNNHKRTKIDPLEVYTLIFAILEL